LAVCFPEVPAGGFSAHSAFLGGFFSHCSAFLAASLVELLGLLSSFLLELLFLESLSALLLELHLKSAERTSASEQFSSS